MRSLCPKYRVALCYLLRDVAWGTLFPYYALALERDGVAPATITRVVAIFPLAYMLVTPVAGRLVDRLSGEHTALRIGAALCVAICPAYFWVHDLIGHVAVTLVFAAVFVPTGTLCEVLSVRAARHWGGEYGRIRSWGAVGFCLASLIGGPLIQRWGVDVIFITALSSLVAMLLVSLTIPALPDPSPDATLAEDRPRRGSLGHLAARWPFFAAMAVYCAAHACYDAGFTLHFAGLGASATLLGLAWGIAQGAEILAFILSGSILRRVRARSLLLFVFAVAALRWFLLAVVDSPMPVLALQVLHAVTFGLFQPAMVMEAFSMSRPGEHNTLMGILGACYGSGQMLAMTFAGALLERSAAALFTTALAIDVLAGVFLLAHIVRIHTQPRGHGDPT